jgi:hypothetical protein
MTPADLTYYRARATRVETYEYRDEGNEDNYIVAELYRCADGRNFRFVESSGMDSVYTGSGDFGEWLTAEEAKKWKKFSG